jgi:hypothetical protein
MVHPTSSGEFVGTPLKPNSPYPARDRGNTRFVSIACEKEAARESYRKSLFNFLPAGKERSGWRIQGPILRIW